MYSIVPKFAVVRCSNCTNLIGSGTPVCSKCGLPTSEAGVVELAEIDRYNEAALSDAESLMHTAIAPYAFIFLALVLGDLLPELTVSPAFISVVCIGVFWFKFFSWSAKYSHNDYPDESFNHAIGLRNRSAIVTMLGMLCLAILIYFRAT